MIKTDIELLINKYKSDSKPEDRFTSFDYCYNYFHSTNNLTEDIEKSCLVLGFYLASWGMFRGSSFILQKNAKHFEHAIRYIARVDKSNWQIDVDNYNEKNIQSILKIYKDIKELLIHKGNAHVTLISKILLGVFGFIPAFDNNFCNSFRAISNGQCGFRSVNTKSLLVIKSFYESNKLAIDKLSAETFTTDFITGEKTTVNYPKAKIIDMYGFSYGEYKKTIEKL